MVVAVVVVLVAVVVVAFVELAYDSVVDVEIHPMRAKEMGSTLKNVQLK